MIKKAMLVIFSVLIGIYVEAQTTIEGFLDEITIDKIRAHIDTLASEDMAGRYSGEYGQKLAAQYIANEFSDYNLTAFNPKSDNPYYQKFDLYKYQTGASEIYYGNHFYWAPVFIGSKSISDSISGQVVFAGSAEQKNIEKLDVKTKSIFFLSPSVKEAITRAEEIQNTRTINTFIVGLPFGKKIDEKLFSDSITNLNSFKELFYYSNYYLPDHRNKEDFQKLLDKNRVIPHFKISSDKDIKILFVPEDLSGALFKKDFKHLKKVAENTRKSKKYSLKNIHPAEYSYVVNYDPIIDTIRTENVIGYLDSELSEEKIIIGAHYDHVGTNEKGEIRYGADDNASGTAAILCIAQSINNMIESGISLTKDIVFIAYSGEELGLHGSEYYVQNPLFPLSETEVLFNLDMIGRDKDNDPDYSNTVFLIHWEGGANYLQNIENLNANYTNLVIDKDPDPKDKTLWTYGSDHYSFANKGISSIAYFTALHPDYHTPGDTPDKINYDKLNRITRLVFLNIWDLTVNEE